MIFAHKNMKNLVLLRIQVIVKLEMGYGLHNEEYSCINYKKNNRKWKEKWWGLCLEYEIFSWLFQILDNDFLFKGIQLTNEALIRIGDQIKFMKNKWFKNDYIFFNPNINEMDFGWCSWLRVCCSSSFPNPNFYLT